MFRELIYLDLSNNDIKQTDDIRVEGLTSLRYLYMGHNSLKYVHEYAFKDMRELLHLDLRYCTHTTNYTTTI